MNCQQISKYMYDYCDGNVSPQIKQEIEEHLKHCFSCSNNFKLTIIENGILQSPDTPKLPADFTLKIIKALSPEISISAPDSTPEPGITDREENGHRFKAWQSVLIATMVAVLALAFYITPASTKHQMAASWHRLVASLNGQGETPVGTEEKKAQVAMKNNSTPSGGKAAADSSGSGLQAQPARKSNASSSNPSGPTKSSSDQLTAERLKNLPEVGRSAPVTTAFSQKSAPAYNLSRRCVPRQLPADYRLINIRDNGSGNTTFYYQSQDKRETLSINLATGSAEATSSQNRENFSTDSSSPLPMKASVMNGQTFSGKAGAAGNYGSGQRTSSGQDFNMGAQYHNTVRVTLDSPNGPVQATLNSNIPLTSLNDLAHKMTVDIVP